MRADQPWNVSSPRRPDDLLGCLRLRYRACGLGLLSVTASTALSAPPIAPADSSSVPGSHPPSSVYALETSQEISAIGTGIVLLGGAAILLNQQAGLDSSEVAALDPDDLPPIDRGATTNWSPEANEASDVLIAALVVAPGALIAAGPDGRTRWTVFTMYAETLLLTNGVAQLLKGMVERTRPYAYNDDPDIPPERRTDVDARRSFPSGHTSNAFAAATFLGTVTAHLYPESGARPWVWAGALTAATAIAALRVAAGEHFPTDVMMGAILGSAVGLLVPKLHETDRVRVGAHPAGAGLSIRWVGF